MKQWAPFSRNAWAVRVILLAGAAVVISGVGGWLVSALALLFMLAVLRTVLSYIRRR
jgi:hypothetical protein